MICYNALRVFTGILWGFFFGTCFLSGIAFLTGHQVYYETSDSMSPVIKKGSLLFVKEKEYYKVGDIVAFSAMYGGQAICVTHRIIACDEQDDSYITKGDANDQADEEIVMDKQIYGQVTEYIPLFGYACFYIQKNSIWVLLLLLLFFLWDTEWE